MNGYTENPVPQPKSKHYVLNTSENGYQHALRQVFQKYGLSPNSVYTVLELGCGAGSMTDALLKVCQSIRTLHAVDYGVVLQMELFDSQIVIPIIGLISTVIEQPPICESLYDLIVCCTMSSHHGLNNWQLHVLAQKLRSSGYLLTLGDNGNLTSNNFFRKTFVTQLNGRFDDDTILWKKK